MLYFTRGDIATSQERFIPGAARGILYTSRGVCSVYTTVTEHSNTTENYRTQVCKRTVLDILGSTSNTRRHKNSDNPNANINPKT